MKDRLLTLAGGLLALYIVIALLTPPTQPEFASRPLTTDRDRHGLSLLYEWLAANQLDVHSQRQRYDDLFSNPELPATGNLLVVSLPLKVSAHRDEQAQLRQWLAQGNTILLLVAHSDYPEWVRGNRVPTLFSYPALLSSLGFNIVLDEIEVPANDEQDSSEKDDTAVDEQRISFSDFDSNKLEDGTLAATDNLHGAIDNIMVSQLPFGNEKWKLSPREKYRSSRVLLEQAGEQAAPAMWHVRVGEGDAVISRYADLFSNAWLDKAGNSRLFEQLLAQHLAADGYVIFDDMHQGLSDIYDPGAFFSDPRLHNTLWFLFGFWLLYLVGYTNRLAPPLKKKPVAHAADFIRAIGGLFARRLSNPASALGLLRHFFNEVREQYRLPMNGQPAWDVLGTAARIDAQQIDSLQESYRLAQQGRKQDLVKLHNQLRETRKCLL